MNKDKLLLLITILYKRRTFLLIHFILASVIAVSYALSAKKTYSSSATILPPGANSVLNSFLPAEMTQGLGGAISALTGSSGDATNKILAILIAENLLNK